MRVLLIHQAFVGPDEPGGTRHYELARRAVQHGIQFTVVASNLGYLTGEQVSADQKTADQQLDGIRVLRAYTYPSLHRSFVWRVVAFFSFMLASIRTARSAGPVDLVMGTSPPIFQAVSAWLVAVLRRSPFLLEIRDLWPAFAVDMGVLRSRPLIWLSRRLERFLYARATHLLVNSPAYREYLIEMGVPADKITLIANGVDAGLFDPEARGEAIRTRYHLQDKYVVTYAGALGLANAIETIVQAAGLLKQHLEIHFLLVGDGKERRRLESLAQKLELDNLTFAGVCPKSEMPDLLAASDACIATLKNIPMFRTTYPNKVFDYMAAGRPTVLGIDGVIRQVIEAANGGIYVPPGDEQALAETVLSLSRDRQLGTELGRNARVYVEQHFNRDRQGAGFVALLNRLAPARAAAPWFSYRRIGKRLFDLGVTLPALLVCAPLLGFIALAVRLKLGGPVLFRQRRPGLNGRPFTLFKFRTMTDDRDAAGCLLPDGERLTRFGRLLRASSLDELPELLNVIRGEMSLVGPRPLLMEYLDRYSPEEARRHEVKPGLTGWAQINGRNAVSWAQRFRFDLEYVSRISFAFDLKILALTGMRVLRREGISADGHASMPLFMGSDREKP
jgi:lipopolysaccharide/colanic/teichoic acid biosynthesis glycosyltransferase/glycosyltransferase involved in cell wall biosynthesis